MRFNLILMLKSVLYVRMASKSKIKTINLALQGGGSHGAFTWGVLDALLEDERLDFEGISATSAGAINAAALAQGVRNGGASEARTVLEDLWQEISNVGAFYNPFTQSQNAFEKFWNLNANPAYNQFQAFLEGIAGTVSPYEFNPLNINPLRSVLENVLTFEDIHACTKTKLFITATDVERGVAEVFQNDQISLDVLLASAGLPLLFQATEIDGQAYWDGGYMGNPSLYPLFYKAEARDILLVHVNPIKREGVPKEMIAIENRLNEITFNTALLKELRSIDFVQRLIREDMLRDEYKDQYKDVLLHAVRADDALRDLPAASKFDTDWGFLKELRDLGRAEAQKWLEAHFDDIGARDSVDIRRDYLDI